MLNMQVDEIKKIVNSIQKSFIISGYDYDDLFLEGVLTALEAINEYDEKYGTKLSTYVYMRVHRRFITINRANKAQKRNPLERINFESTTLAENGVLYGSTLLIEATQEIEILKKEFNGELKEICENLLNNKEIKLLNLYLEGHTIEELAVIYDESVKQISNKIYYLKTKLRKNKDKFEKLKKML